MAGEFPSPRRTALPAFAVALLLAAPAVAQTVYAAASLTAAMEAFAATLAPELKLSFAASSVLARQIESGAPADLFISASTEWMDYLESAALIAPGTRLDLVGNRLVLVAAAGEHQRWRTFSFRASAFPADLLHGRLAMADPDHVPAGIYARQALQALGWWPALAPRLAPAPHVRAALAWVERGHCPAGIVYATDAATSAGVRTVAAVPDSLHQRIRYPAAAIAGRLSAEVAALLEQLRSPTAAALFQHHGFLPLSATTDTVATTPPHVRR